MVCLYEVPLGGESFLHAYRGHHPSICRKIIPPASPNKLIPDINGGQSFSVLYKIGNKNIIPKYIKVKTCQPHLCKQIECYHSESMTMLPLNEDCNAQFSYSIMKIRFHFFFPSLEKKSKCLVSLMSGERKGSGLILPVNFADI